jgi:hypothetical protein
MNILQNNKLSEPALEYDEKDWENDPKLNISSEDREKLSEIRNTFTPIFHSLELSEMEGFMNEMANIFNKNKDIINKSLLYHLLIGSSLAAFYKDGAEYIFDTPNGDVSKFYYEFISKYSTIAA